MKKLLFALVFVGATFTSTIEAKERTIQTFDKISVVIDKVVCEVVVTYTDTLTINSDGSTTRKQTKTTTFIPCSQQ
jgi:hypothetical protein